jgi:hypothetical protein
MSEGEIGIDSDYQDMNPIGAYSDMVRISYNPYTFNFEFAQQIPPKTPDKLSGSKCIGTIVMSPSHAKVFYEYLGEIIGQYEKNLGPINSFNQMKK